MSEKLGDKIPGTYCPLCGEIGLRELVVNGVTWAVCPMIDGEPQVKKLKDAHTAYVTSTAKAKPKPKPRDPEPNIGSAEEIKNNEEGVNHE